MLRGAILLIFFITGNSNEEGDWLKCKPKPGCSIPKCDPPPGQLFENPDKLDDYSILCQKNKPPDDSEIDVLEREITRMKSQMEKERTDRESKLNYVLKKINTLERRNRRMKIQMEQRESRTQKERNEDENTLNNALKKINILEREITRMKSNMEEMESRTEKERDESESTLNNALEISCAITSNGICYWTDIELNSTFERAEEICSNMASTPANFPSEEVYNSVVEDVRSKVPSEYNWIKVWAGITINTNTGNVTHPSGDTYVKWDHSNPYIGDSYEIWSHVALHVSSKFSYIHDGMYNFPPQWSFDGVVCQSVE